MCCEDCPEYKKCREHLDCCTKCRYYEDGNCTYSAEAEESDMADYMDKTSFIP